MQQKYPPSPGLKPEILLEDAEIQNLACSVLFDRLAGALPEASLSMGELLQHFGQQGLLIFCLFLTLPSMIFIPIPGFSIPQGFVLMLASFALWQGAHFHLPARMAAWRLPVKVLNQVLSKGAMLFRRIEILTRPRLEKLAGTAFSRNVNFLLMAYNAFLLMLPWPLPTSNFIPALGIFLLAVANLQRDGLVAILGYIQSLVATVFFIVTSWAGVALVQKFWDKFFG